MNRMIEDKKIEQSKNLVINNVMDQLDEYQSKKRLIPRRKLYFVFSMMFAAALLFVGLISSDLFNQNPIAPTPVELLNDAQSEQVATIGYISTALLSHDVQLSMNNFMVSSNFDLLAQLNELEIEENIDEFHVYFNMLLPFFEEDPMNDVVITELIDSDYEQELVFNVQDDEYILYVNVDGTVFSGMLIRNGVEYTITGEIEQYEEELQLKFTASNESGFIKVEYKYQEGSEKKFEITQNLNGIEVEKELKVSFEGTEYSVELSENEDSYEISREVSNGQVVYELEYEVNGQEGEAVITEQVDEFGNITYHYAIDEDGEEIEFEKEDEEDEIEEEDEEDD